MAEPLLLGASKVMVASSLPRVAITLVGALGVVAGVTALLAAELALVPTSLVAVIVKV